MQKKGRGARITRLPKTEWGMHDWADAANETTASYIGAAAAHLSGAENYGHMTLAVVFRLVFLEASDHNVGFDA